MRTLALAGVVLLSGCSFDLGVPPLPARGSATGVLDTQGHVAPADLTVVLVRGDGTGSVTTRTDADGGFAFADLAPGPYLLQASVPGFAPLREGPFVVLAGTPTDLGTLRPAWLGQTESEATVTGVVLVDTAGGASDAGGRPSDAQGAVVRFRLDGIAAPVAEVAVDAFGGFSARVPPGRYSLEAAHPYFVTATRSGVDFAAGARVDLRAQPLVLQLNPAEVSGTVLLEVDKAPDAGAGAGVLVVADTGVTAATDAQGRFRLGGLAGGTRTLLLQKAGYHDAQPQRLVVLAGGERRELGTVTLLLDRGDLTGGVEMTDGTRLADTTVEVVGLPYAAQVSAGATPSTGRFALGGLPVGTYTLRAARTNYVAAVSGAVTVRAGGVTDVGTLRLARIQGDFSIDDADATNTPGYTATRSVTLRLQQTTGAAQLRVAEGSLSALSAAAYQPFTTSDVPFTLSSGDGLKQVFVQVKDAMGNEGPPLSNSVLLDMTPPARPSVVIASGADFVRQANPLPLTLTADDPGSGLASVRLDELPADAGVLTAPRQTYLRELSFTRSSSADGPVAVRAQLFDHAGNASAVVMDTAVVDTQAPTGTLSFTRGPRATVDGSTDSLLVTLDGAASAEPHGGFLRVRLANAVANLSGAVAQPFSAAIPWFLDGAGSATKTVHYQLVDAAENVSAPGQVVITYDATPPTVSLALSSPAVSSSRSITLSVTGADTVALSPSQALTLSESLLFTGAAPSPLPSGGTQTFQVSAGDGVKTIFARVRDAAGNDAVASVTMTLDTTAPTATGLALTGALADGTPSETVTTSATVTLRLQPSDATEVFLGDGTVSACPATGWTAVGADTRLNYPLPGAGAVRTVTACFRDAAGNVANGGTPHRASITLDASAPTGCQVQLTGVMADGATATGGALVDQTATRRVTVTLAGCSEAPAVVLLTEGAPSCSPTLQGDFRPYTPGMTFDLSTGDGPKQVRGCVRDAALNTAAVAPDGITLDTLPPDAAQVTVHGGRSVFNQADFTAAGGANRVTVQAVAPGAQDWAASDVEPPTNFVALVGNNPRQVTLSVGDGQKTVAVVFRDALGNTSAPLRTPVLVDTTAPSLTGVTLAVVPTGCTTPAGGLPCFVNSVSATLTLAGAPADVVQVQLGNAAGASCADPDVAGRPLLGTFAAATHLLTAGDGVKRVCAKLLDAAGNASGLLTAVITLDATPPTAPRITTPPQLVRFANGASFTVTTSGAVTDANFSRYQRLGGLSGGTPLTQWVDASTAIGTTTFNFQLQATGAAAGTPNLLRLRAVDLAGNVGPDDSVVVTADPVKPPRVALADLGVNNQSQRATVYFGFDGGAAPDVAYFEVSYGPSSQAQDGQSAAEGPSPFTIPATQRSVTLTGLQNGTTTFVTIRAVDQAGNVSDAPITPASVLLSPNTYSPSRIGDLSLAGITPAITMIDDLVSDRTGVWVLGRNCTGQTSTPTVVLARLDLTSAASAFQRGGLNPTPWTPQLTQVVTFPGSGQCQDVDTAPPQLLVDGNWAFVPAGTRLYFVRVRDVPAPVSAGSYDFGNRVVDTALRGNVLFVGGVQFVSALRLTALYDGAPATVPDATAVAGTHALAFNVQSLQLARNALMVRTTSLGGARMYDVSSTINGGAFSGANFVGSASDSLASNVTGDTVVSGSWVLTANTSTLVVRDVQGYFPSFATTPTPPLVGQLNVGGYAGVTSEGPYAFLTPPNSDVQHVVDVSQLSTGALSVVLQRPSLVPWPYPGRTLTAPVGPLNVVAFNYGICWSCPARILIDEVAQPTGLALEATASGGGQYHELMPGFVIGSNGSALDLFGGLAERSATALTSPLGNGLRMARFGETLFAARSTTAYVVNLESATDRSASTATTFSAAALVTLPGSVQVLDLVAADSHTLLVLEDRGAAGQWLRLLDMSALTDLDPMSTFSYATSTRAELQVSSFARTDTLVGRLTLHQGRAVTALDHGYFGLPQPTPAVAFYDLRAWLDDDATTTSAIAQGSIAAKRGVQELRISGNRLWLTEGNFASVEALESWDVTALMDEDAMTTVTATSPLTQTSLCRPGALNVTGTWVFTSTSSSQCSERGTYAFDVSGPTPRRVGYAPLYGAGTISVTGDRLYLSEQGRTDVLRLE